jgi:hypothetical protein
VILKTHFWCRGFLNDFLALLFAARFLAICHRLVHILNVLLVCSPIVSSSAISLIDRLHARLVTARLPVTPLAVKVSAISVIVVVAIVVVVVTRFVRLFRSVGQLSVHFTIFAIVSLLAILAGFLSKVVACVAAAVDVYVAVAAILTYLAILRDLFL